MGAPETPIWNSEREWWEWVEQYAQDLTLLTGMGLSETGRRRLARLADAHNLLPSQMAMFLLNAYLGSSLAQQQSHDVAVLSARIRDADYRLEEALLGSGWLEIAS